MSLRVYNTLTRMKEPFVPIDPPDVGIYVCGPTVYGHSHLGHAKSYVSFDVIVRYLRFSGYNVLYVQNITDVGHLLGDANEGEDRILKQAAWTENTPWRSQKNTPAATSRIWIPSVSFDPIFHRERPGTSRSRSSIIDRLIARAARLRSERFRLLRC